MPKTNQKLNILVSCGSYSWGGLEMAALESSLKLSESGNSVKLLCSENSILHNRAKECGAETLPFFSTDGKLPLTILKLKKFFKNSKTDVVHTHHSHDLWALAPALSSANPGIKLFLTKHVASGVKKNDFFHKKIYKRVNGIFAISSYIKESVLNTTSIPKERVYILPNGVDISRFNKSRYDRDEVLNSLNIKNDKIVIGLIGRITPGKGHIELIEAAKVLNEKFPGKLYFLMVGTSGKGEEKYEQKIRNFAAGIENLLFNGHTDEPQRFMAAFDILAFPSHDESFGRVIIEAMAMQIPVAASGYAGVLDIITDGVTGLLFEPKNYQSLADSLEKLITDEPLRINLSAAGRKLVEEKYTVDFITNKLIELYTK